MFLAYFIINVVASIGLFFVFAIKDLAETEAVALILLIIQLVLNSVMFFKLHRMDQQAKWFTDIAEKNGYREPTGAQKLPWFDENANKNDKDGK